MKKGTVIKMRSNEFIVYRNITYDILFKKMICLINEYDNEHEKEVKRELCYECLNELFELASSHGFHGNIWHCFIADLLVNEENVYSTACEMIGEIEGTLNEAVLHDFEIIKQLLHYDFSIMIKTLDIGHFELLYDYKCSEFSGKVYNTRIRDCICQLAVNLGKATLASEMKNIMTNFYKEVGAGKIGLHKAFRILRQDNEVLIKPILNIQHVYLNDLVGYEIAKKKLIDNTEAFIQGKRANNCLLFGDAGTGKSSCIKGILNEYYDQGLRIIEVYKHQFQDLNDLISQIKNRNYKFIIYMDDLSFEDFEIEYKYLKAVIEGGLEKKPANILIYATSNRRHLVRESFKDKDDRDEELHTNDTVQEKLSLYARFGVSIFFCAPDQKEFNNIIKVLANRHHIQMPEETLLLEANRWELSHGGLSGRTAQQFIDYLLGKQ